MKNIAVYIHWPFCKAKCPYCDFNSFVRENIELDRWNQAYLQEIDNNLEYLSGRRISSIFFGGGTPSLMPSYIVANIIEKLAKAAVIDAKTEITLEANPTSVESQKFKEFAASGVNRVSMGVQSFNKDDLKFLGREHSLEEAIEAIEIAKKYFKRYSFDLIYALPKQTLSAWENELKSALKYAGKHLSLYQLTIEKGTPFYGLHQKKRFEIPHEDLARDFYLLTQDIMNDANLPAYEISNHATRGEECLHNMSYWQYDEFIGIGPGAHGRVHTQATRSVYNPEDWLKNSMLNSSTVKTQLSKQERICEFLLMGLRLTKGISEQDFISKLGVGFACFKQNRLDWMLKHDFLQFKDDYLSATNSGRLVLNRIISELVDEEIVEM